MTAKYSNLVDQSGAVTIPLLNPNEPEALLIELKVEEKQWISAGEVICVLETTKSTAEIEADQDGFVVGLQFRQGEMVSAGRVLCYLLDSPEAKIPKNLDIGDAESGTSGSDLRSGDLPAGLRITKPALAFAIKHHMDLEKLPKDRLITQSELRNLKLKEKQIPERIGKEITMPEPLEPQDRSTDHALIIYGGGGHGKSLIELIKTLKVYDLIGVIDDGLNNNEKVMEIPVLGGSNILPQLRQMGIRLAINAVGGIGDPKARIDIFKKLEVEGYSFPVLIHPSAYVEPSSRLFPGVQIFAHAYIGADASIGFGSIINTGAIISHECSVGKYANISPGAILAGSVEIGNSVLVGMGVTINLGVKIGDGARIGNGATIKEDIPSNWIVRAGSTWPE